MRNKFLITTMSMALIFSGCSQSGSNVPFYRYGEKNSGAGSLGIHTLRSGETLWSIANAYHVDLRDMLDLNRLRAPYNTHAGQRLKIPAPQTYRAHKGDTLYKISRMFDTTTTELARLNNMRPPFSVKADQSLRLPSRHANYAPIIKSAPAPIHSQMASSYVPAPSLPSSPTKIQREELAPIPSQTHVAEPASKHTQGHEAVASVPPEKEVHVDLSAPLSRSGKGFLKPVGGKIISRYGVKADGLHNDGINIQATRGDAVRAAEQGVIVYNGSQIEGYGNMVLIRHADGYMTAYAHMDKILVKKGDRVKRGQTVGTVGSTGHVSTPQLHFEIRKGKNAIDPSPYINI